MIFQSLRRLAPVIKSPLLTASDAKALAEFGQRIRFVDASWHLASTRDAEEEFDDKRIQGAIRLDIDTVKDAESLLPHMLPPERIMQEYVDRHRLVRSSDLICVYTQPNCFSAARGWWMFSAYGFTTAVLQGGVGAWEAAGLPTESGPYKEPEVLPAHPPEKIAFRKELVTNMEEVMWLLNKKGVILDARPHSRWLGTEAEPRPGLELGHIPGSVNVPFRSVLEENDMTSFRPVDELKKVFTDAQIDVAQPGMIVTSCGSGVTASTLSFALHLCGRPIESVPVYDGSWAEWGSKPQTPKATGEEN